MKDKRIYLLMVLVVLGLIRWATVDDTARPAFFSRSFFTRMEMPVSTQPGGAEIRAQEGAISAGEDVNSEFKIWFNDEVKDMEKSSLDIRAKEKSLQEAASHFSVAQIQFLKKRTMDMKSPANDRILATYVLTLAPDEFGIQALQEIVQAPLVMAGEHPTHSPEETLAMQEKSIRRMALDALLAKAQANADYRDAFLKAINEINDTSLRDYAEKSYRKIK